MLTRKVPRENADIAYVSAVLSGNVTSAEESRLRLSTLVRHFDRDADSSRKSIRDLVERDPESFYTGAIEILKEHDDSRGSQFVVAMLASYDLLLRALCDPAFTREQAIELARAAARVDPMTDVGLARRLADSATAPDSAMSADRAGRAMELLAEISDGTRILPSLMRLMRHSNPYVRSKAVKLVGRGGSVKWVRGRLAESDPRIRANAIEALWGVDNEEARELLLAATRDGNNRVAGNALLALYRLGDCSMIPEILKMADHGSALFRSTAAWVMGETGDERFTEVLAKLLRESNAAIRTRAMKSLGRIKAAMAQSRQGSHYLATGIMLDCDPQKRRLQLSVTSTDGAQYLKILPTQVLLCEDGRQVIQYKVTERPEPDAMSVVFVFPRTGIPGTSAWTVAALNCLNWKRSSDLWAVETYTADNAVAGGDASTGVEGPRFSACPDLITAALRTPAPRPDCAEFWRSIWNAVRPDQGQSRGKRHVIVFSDAPPERSPGDGLISAVIASRCIVQVISTVANANLQRFCQKAGAGFKAADTGEGVTREIELAYLNLLARYEIGYSSSAPVSVLKIRISTPDGWAEANFSLTG